MDLSCCAGAGPLLATAAAFLFATGVQFTRYGVVHTDSPIATMIQIGTAAGCYWLVASWFLQFWFWLQPAVLLLAAIGLLREAEIDGRAALGVVVVASGAVAVSLA